MGGRVRTEAAPRIQGTKARKRGDDTPVSRFPELEGYRGMAAILVIVFHSYQTSRETKAFVYQDVPVVNQVLSNLDTWVSLFFGLSGFLIFLPYAYSIVEGRKGLSARGFLVRRFIRILPLYVVAISVVWASRYPGGADTWWDLGEHLTFTHVFSPTHVFTTIGPAWSLADEFLFYVFTAFFGLAWTILGRRIPWRTARWLGLTTSILALAAVSTLAKPYIALVLQKPSEQYNWYFNPVVKFDEFALGMLLAMIAVAPSRPRRLLGTGSAILLGFLGAGLISSVLALRGNGHVWIEIYGSTITGLGWICVYATTILGPRGSRLERMMSVRWLTGMGVISYSVYLWHEPILHEITVRHWVDFSSPTAFPIAMVTLLGLSIFAGVSSYWLIEWPVAESRHLFTGDGRLKDRYRPRSMDTYSAKAGYGASAPWSKTTAGSSSVAASAVPYQRHATVLPPAGPEPEPAPTSRAEAKQRARDDRRRPRAVPASR